MSKSPAAAGSPRMTVGTCAALACLWEATAAKPGNVYRGADFADLTYADFLASAAIVGPVLERTAEQGVGATVLQAVQQTRAAVATNTNLGMLLLLAPLAAAQAPLSKGISKVLSSLSREDAEFVFEAIREANPGGLGSVNHADVNDTTTPKMTLLEAMQLAAERDLIARQYTDDFALVFQLAGRMESSTRRGLPLGDAIVHTYLHCLAEHPDSLIARKCGGQIARDVSTQAAAVLAVGEPRESAYEMSLRGFDFSLRTDGHRRNPGTTADLIAAALFVLLREDRLEWPVRFYRTSEPVNFFRTSETDE